MKVIDYSPIDENIFITTDNDEGYIKIFENNILIYSSSQNPDIYAQYICFSHDGRNVLFIDNFDNIENLTIIPYSELINNNFRNGPIFNFSTDGQILNFAVSPNYNHVAILFINAHMFIDNIEGEIQIIPESHNKCFLHVYDFTIDHFRLVFHKIFDYNDDDNVKISLSELGTIAIASKDYEVDIDNVDNDLFEIAIYDLTTGNKVMNTFVNYIINHIQYFPEIEPYYNKLLLVAHERGIAYIKKIDLEDNFRQISNKQLDNYDALSVGIQQNGNIAIGTDNGLIYFTSLDEQEQENMVIFEEIRVVDIALSRSGYNVAVASNMYDEIYEQHYLNISVYNFRENRIILESIRENQLIPDVQHAEEWEHYSVDEEDDVIEDPDLDTCLVPSTNIEKLDKHGSQSCFNIIEGVDEDNIGNYLSSDKDNIVIFFKKVEDPDFFATCLTFTALKVFLKDPKSVYYSCVKGKPDVDYHRDPPEYFKIPSQNNIYVSYSDIKDKYMQRQNMIFLEYEKKIDETISYNVSISNNTVSGWHCGKGTSIDVYHIIF